MQKFNFMECGKSDFQFKVIEKIKNLRLQNNVSQRQLALLLELSPGEVGNIESLKYKNKYTLKHIGVIAKHFGVPIQQIFFDDTEIYNGLEEFFERITAYLY